MAQTEKRVKLSSRNGWTIVAMRTGGAYYFTFRCRGSEEI